MRTIEVTEREASDIMFGMDNIGYCLSCGEEAYGCEPDARNYTCESCGERQVFGFEECLIMGNVTIIESDSEC